MRKSWRRRELMLYYKAPEVGSKNSANTDFKTLLYQQRVFCVRLKAASVLKQRGAMVYTVQGRLEIPFCAASLALQYLNHQVDSTVPWILRIACSCF